jgi:hypothetical protein
VLQVVGLHLEVVASPISLATLAQRKAAIERALLAGLPRFLLSHGFVR